jgi:hypothetical protein
MRKQKLARKRVSEGSLPELLDRLELALMKMLDRAPVQSTVGCESSARPGQPGLDRTDQSTVAGVSTTPVRRRIRAAVLVSAAEVCVDRTKRVIDWPSNQVYARSSVS